MRLSLAIWVCLLASLPASPESLEFTIYRLADDEQELIAGRKLDYSISDIEVRTWGSERGHPTWKKTLKLSKGFNIGIMVTRGDDLVSGFGLWIANDHHPRGFSWEWFVHEDGDTFKKLQGDGRVRTTLAETAGGVEIRSVEFLSDIRLRFKEEVSMEPPGHSTHEVVVSKGSVFRFAL